MNTTPGVTMQEEYFATREKTKADEFWKKVLEDVRRMANKLSELLNALKPQERNMEYIKYNGRSMPACNIKGTVRKVTASLSKTFNFHTCSVTCARPP